MGIPTRSQFPLLTDWFLKMLSVQRLTSTVKTDCRVTEVFLFTLAMSAYIILEVRQVQGLSNNPGVTTFRALNTNMRGQLLGMIALPPAKSLPAQTVKKWHCAFLMLVRITAKCHGHSAKREYQSITTTNYCFENIGGRGAKPGKLLAKRWVRVYDLHPFFPPPPGGE